MRLRLLPLIAAGILPLAACASQDERPIGPPPPPPPGAVPGSIAADRDGDGIVDGYYTSDGIYHALLAPPPPPPPPPPPTRRGERG